MSFCIPTVSGIYEMFCNHKNFYIGKQPEPFPGTDTVHALMMFLDNVLKLLL